MDLNWLQALTRRRPLPTPQQQQQQLSNSRNELQRRLNAWDLIFYGIGCSVGAGIYSLVGVGASTAGPSIALGFALAGIACCFTSLAYAEFAALIQTAGSAYTYAYVAFGELVGWLVGWNLTLGYAVSAAVVARSWAEYVVGSLLDLDPNSKHWSFYLTKFPLFGNDEDSRGDDVWTCCPLSMVIIAICTGVLVIGTKESTRFNTIMTILNLTVLGLIVVVGSFVIANDTTTTTADNNGTTTTTSMLNDNWHPFFPNGVTGMAQGAGLVFFSYLGFDMVSCLSEEVVQPEINMPIGIIGSLGVSITIYVTVAAIVVGLAPIPLLGNDIPIVNALLANACCTHQQQLDYSQSMITDSNFDNNNPTATTTALECLSYTCNNNHNNNDDMSFLFVISRVVSIGAVFGLTTATFTCLMGQPRIFYSIAKDGLFFPIYSKVNPKTGIPTMGTIITGFWTAIIACLFDLESLANVISLGTLQVFTFVNAGVILLRLRPTSLLLAGGEGGSDEDRIEAEDREHHRKPSPLAQSPRSDAIARSLGLINQTSVDVRKSLRSSARSSARDLGVDIPSLVAEEERQHNATKTTTVPILYLLGFTLSALLLSVAIAKEIYSVCGIMVLSMAFCTVGLYSLMPKSSTTTTTNNNNSRSVLLQLQKTATFQCPMVPAVPLCGILCNCYMMGSMQSDSWILIAIWLSIGLTFYFGYGIHHSILNNNNNNNNNSQDKHITNLNQSNKISAGSFGENQPLLLSSASASKIPTGSRRN